MNKPIRIEMKVDESDVLRLGDAAAFANALTEHEDLPWIKFLREHGEIAHVEHFKEPVTYRTIDLTHWQLPDELNTWFYLNYADILQG